MKIKIEEITLEEALKCVTKEIKRVTPNSFEFGD